MTRETYYFILLFGLSGLLIYSLLTIFHIVPHDRQIITTGILKPLFALFIIIYETTTSKRIYQRLNWTLLPISFMGYMFSIMHWPFGLALFLIPLTTILISLFVSALKSTADKFLSIVTLTFPSLHLIFIVIKIFHFPGASFFMILQLIVVTIIIIGIGIRLARSKQNLPYNP
jgi:hypothetical protein